MNNECRWYILGIFGAKYYSRLIHIFNVGGVYICTYMHKLFSLARFNYARQNLNRSEYHPFVPSATYACMYLCTYVDKGFFPVVTFESSVWKLCNHDRLQSLTSSKPLFCPFQVTIFEAL
jgi:hypothetical protein